MPGASSPAASPAVGTAGPTPEEIQAQIQTMFEARSKEMEDKLKGQYDDRIKQLQKQLEDSKKRPTAGRRGGAGRPPSRRRPSRPRVAPKPEPAGRGRAAAPPRRSPPRRLPRGRTKPAPAPAPSQPPRRRQPAAPRPQAQVQLGDLVQPGAGVAAPKLASNLDPRYPPAAKHLNRSAQVDIKVLVDERGRVLDADRIGAKAGFGFDEAAIDAARKARLPARHQGRRAGQDVDHPAGELQADADARGRGHSRARKKGTHERVPFLHSDRGAMRYRSAALRLATSFWMQGFITLSNIRSSSTPPPKPKTETLTLRLLLAGLVGPDDLARAGVDDAGVQRRHELLLAGRERQPPTAARRWCSPYSVTAPVSR